MLAAFCDALGLATIDLVGNDSGGGIAQIFAAKHAARVRTLTLTDCDVHDNWPPPAIQPLLDASKAGQLGALGRMWLADPNAARAGLGIGYEQPDDVPDDMFRAYLAPIFGTPERTKLFEDLFAQMFFGRRDDLTSLAPALQKLAVPTLIVWGDDDVFFPTIWANWLRRTIPGARDPIIVPRRRLFFPQERPETLIGPLQALWTTAATGGAAAGRGGHG